MDIFNPLPSHERNEPIYTPQGGPPQTDAIPSAVYEAMGEENIIAFFHAFYRRLAESSIADMFPKSEKNLLRAADKSADMFTFLFGGPHLYQKRHGPPMMRARHIPFVIDEAARESWLACYRATLDESVDKFSMPAEHVDAVWNFVTAFSAWMVNAE